MGHRRSTMEGALWVNSLPEGGLTRGFQGILRRSARAVYTESFPEEQFPSRRIDLRGPGVSLSPVAADAGHVYGTRGGRR